MTDQPGLIKNLRLPNGDDADIRIVDGLIAEIDLGLEARSDEDVIDGGGELVLPGLVDGHMHLDKTLTGTPWMAHRAGPIRKSRIETERNMRADLAPVEDRASNLVRLCIGHGTTAIRTHVDIDPTIGLKHVEALVKVREKFAGALTMQLVAFPQSGVQSQPGIPDQLSAAIDAGADLVGGIDPIAVDDDLDGQLDTLFAIAEKKGVGIDIHLHDPGANGQREIAAVTRRAKSHCMAGHATISHGFCLGAADDDVLHKLVDEMAEAGVSLVTHGGGASPLPPVKFLRERGVEVFAGNDDVRDTWSPLGEGDMLERATMIAWRSGYRTDDDLLIALDCVSAAGKRALGLSDAGMAVGAPADFFTVKAELAADAVARHPQRNLVFKNGRIVAREEVYGA
jgi:cytosine deaminase